jgi:GT2 family glycosyltransferase
MNRKYHWFILLNNDTIVAENFIDEFHLGALNSEGYSILALIILYYNNPSTIWYLGKQLIGNTMLAIDNYKKRKVDRNLPLLIPIDFANGFVMMVNKTVFEKTGFLDESLFMYSEEVDFCWRARLTGFKFACFTSARIWHKILKSSQNDQPFVCYLRIRNQIYFYRRYSHGIQKLGYLFFTLSRTFIICSIDVLKWKTTLILPSLHGWWGGWYINNPLHRLVNS